MDPEYELDALLSAKRGEQPAAGRPPGTRSVALAAALAAARHLDPLRRAEPSPDFVRALEGQLLTRVGVLAMRPAVAQATRGSIAQRGARKLAPRWRWSPWLTVAAVLLLVVVGSGFLLHAAALATPGSPLYGLRRLEQTVRVQLAGSDAARARLHLQYAGEALDALDAALARHASSGAYGAALDTYQSEMRSAAAMLALVPAGAEHDAISAQFAALTQRGRHDLLAALPGIDWPERITTTRVLGQLGASVPTVTGAQVVVMQHGASAKWQVTVQGTGFQPGATLLLDAQPAGTVRSISPTQLEATVEIPPAESVTSVGIGNPDDTASATTNLQKSSAPDDHGRQATPTPTSTAGHGKGG
jgi:hypothetical protein